MKKRLVAFSLLSLVFASGTAHAVTFGFSNITNNNDVDAAAGEAQLFVDVTSAAIGADNLVSFYFRNVGPAASSITDIYFDDRAIGALFAGDIYSIIDDGVNVDFEPGASPGNLPGGNTVSFVSSLNLMTDSEQPIQPKGVNPGEHVEILLKLSSSVSFADVLAAMGEDLSYEDSFRVGIHVQGFPNDGSEAFVSTPSQTPVPEPGAMLLLGSGLAGLAGIARRRKL